MRYTITITITSDCEDIIVNSEGVADLYPDCEQLAARQGGQRKVLRRIISQYAVHTVYDIKKKNKVNSNIYTCCIVVWCTVTLYSVQCTMCNGI